MKYEELRIEFNSLNEVDQWNFALKNKEDITINIDNDCTSFTFNSEDKTDDCTIFDFKSDIGNREGIILLLELFGLKAQHV